MRIKLMEALVEDKFTFLELSDWTGGEWSNTLQAGHLGGVSNDTRSIEKGSIYIAIRGENHDGHDFVEDAFKKGSVAAIVDRKWFEAQSGLKAAVCTGRNILIVDDTRKALRDMALGYRIKIGAEIIGVTGSAGKTTVKEMTAKVLSASFPTACTKGNWNNDIGLPLSMLSMDKRTRMGVFEVGTNHPGELTYLCSMLQPVCGVVTNVGPVHIEFFESVEAIAREKAVLLECLPAHGAAVLCVDNDYNEILASRAKCRIITVSLNGDADYRYLGKCAGDNIEIQERSSGDKFTYRMQLPGRHNIVNAMMAIAVGRYYGVEWDCIKSALEEFKSLPMRWEKMAVGGLKIINDAYNANPISMRAAIRAFEEEKAEGEKWLVLAGMKELGAMARQEHISLGEFVGEGSWKGVVLIGEYGEMMATGVESTGYEESNIYKCSDNSDAVKVLKNNTQGGDVVLFKASRGMRLEEIINQLK